MERGIVSRASVYKMALGALFTNMKSIIKTAVKLILNRGVGSQFGEDKILEKILPPHGFYVDIGAYHPHLYSNTYFLYKKGWHGIVVEPNKDMKVLFNFFRPRDTFVHAGVGSGVLTYNSYDDAAYNGFNTVVPSRVKLITSYSVKCLLLSEIVKDVPLIDFLNIDVEGMDLEVLKSHDWSLPPAVICVEGEEASPTTDYLLGKGYVLHAVKGASLIFKL